MTEQEKKGLGDVAYEHISDLAKDGKPLYIAISEYASHKMMTNDDMMAQAEKIINLDGKEDDVFFKGLYKASYVAYSIMHDQMDGSLELEIQDIYLDMILQLHDSVSKELGVSFDSEELDNLFKCTVLATMMGVHKGLTTMEVASWIADESSAWSFSDPKAYYQWAKNEMGWKVGDLRFGFNGAKDRAEHVDADVEEFYEGMTKAISLIIPGIMEMHVKNDDQLKYMGRFYADNKECVEALFQGAMFMPSILPSSVNFKKVLSDDENCRQLFKAYAQGLAGDAVKPLLNDSNGEEAYFFFRLGLHALFFLKDYFPDNPIFQQGSFLDACVDAESSLC